MSDISSWPTTTESIPPPPWSHRLLEWRAVAEWGLGWAVPVAPWPSLRHLEPVVLVSGWMTSGWAMARLARHLTRAGYQVHVWDRWNWGPSPQALQDLEQYIANLSHALQQKIHIVGWSLGGAMGYMVAKRLPEQAASLITLGAPLRAQRSGSSLQPLFDALCPPNEPHWHQAWRHPPACPTTSIVSFNDGVVSWKNGHIQSTPKSQTLVIRHASHLGMPANPLVMSLVLDRLRAAQHKTWRSYRPKGWWCQWVHTSHWSKTRRAPPSA